ncbi:MAG: ABC transporter permease [Actinobacteria bacterium]|jgi:ribose transport system permease protein|nr:ABC transporter permease [Actinomycetota bacterium]
MTTQNSVSSPTDANKARRRLNFGFDRFSGLYVFALLVIVFALWIPNLFLSVNTARSTLAQEAITAIIALGLLIPIAAGVFDLSVAGSVSVGAAVALWFQTNGFPWPLGVIGALVVGVLIGALNGVVIVNLKVDSFIATLGMSSILVAMSYWATDGKQVVAGIQPGFIAFGQFKVLTFPLSFFYMLILAAILYFILEYRPAGRRLYAVGGNPIATRLAGVRTGRVIRGSLISSAVIASFAGTLLAAQLGNATPDMGAPYLLPAFSAVFLGATQIRPGRVNVLGTLVAILLLATGVKGLQLLGAPTYIPYLFNGLALIVAVALAVRPTRKTKG